MEDLLKIRSVLEDGAEEVPAHVWEGVSEGLDKVRRRKTVFLWTRRVGAASAVAAALFCGIFFGLRQPDRENVIQVVEPDPTAREVTSLAMAEDNPTVPVPGIVRNEAGRATVMIMESRQAEAEDDEVTAAVPEQQEGLGETPAEQEGTVVEEASSKDETIEIPGNTADRYDSGDWEEIKEKKSRKGMGTSLVLSGLTGTNSTRPDGGISLMKRPVPSYSPAVTGVKQSSTTSTFGVPLSAGIGVKFNFTRRWSLGVGINYSYLTRKFYGTYTEVAEDGSIDYSESADFRNSQHFIGIPVNAYFNILDNDRIFFYTYAGGTVERCVADKYMMLGKDITYSEKPKGVQWSANIGIGVEFMLGKTVGIYLDPSLRYYFNCGQSTSIRTQQPLMLAFEAGLRFRL